MSARLTRRGLLAAASVVPLAGCLPQRGASTERLVIAGGEPGGAFSTISRLLARQLVAREVAEVAPVRLTSGSVDNLERLRAGDAHLAPCLADSAVRLDDPDLVALARICQNTLLGLVRDDGEVRTVEDLVGRRLAIGPEGSGTADTTVRLLTLAGIGDPSLVGDLWVYRTPGDGVISLAGGTVDAMFWFGGLPSAEIAAIAVSHPLLSLDLSSLVPAANEVTDDVFQIVRASASTYGRQQVSTVGVACYLMCRRELPDDVAAAVVDLVAETGTLLVPQPSDGIQYFLPATLFDTEPMPLHPAAAARYRERHG